MARDEVMMFPNERIKTWLANNRVNSRNSEEGSGTTPHEESNLEFESVEPLETEQT